MRSFNVESRILKRNFTSRREYWEYCIWFRLTEGWQIPCAPISQSRYDSVQFSCFSANNCSGCRVVPVCKSKNIYQNSKTNYRVGQRCRHLYEKHCLLSLPLISSLTWIARLVSHDMLPTGLVAQVGAGCGYESQARISPKSDSFFLLYGPRLSFQG